MNNINSICIIVYPFNVILLEKYLNQGAKLIKGTLSEREELQSPIEIDMINFGEWNNNKLKITCEEFLNGSNTVKLELDENSFQITIK